VEPEDPEQRDFCGESQDLQAEMNSQFNHVDNQIAEMLASLDAAVAGQQHIVGLLQRLIGNRGHGPR